MLFALSMAVWAEGKAKYVFYFIGDGMGVNQVNGTQTYLAALEGRIGVTPLCFTQFPNAALVTTYSATNGVTDSAAAGTALATGNKTRNGALGVLADKETEVTSVAQWASQAGAAVGVSTSVSVDHATPAAFYAHQGGRGSYYAIGQDLVKADFDFYAGSDFMQPTGKKRFSLALRRMPPGWLHPGAWLQAVSEAGRQGTENDFASNRGSQQNRPCLVALCH